jgi:hypothetical protein
MFARLTLLPNRAIAKTPIARGMVPRRLRTSHATVPARGLATHRRFEMFPITRDLYSNFYGIEMRPVYTGWGWYLILTRPFDSIFALITIAYSFNIALWILKTFLFVIHMLFSLFL